MATRSTIAMVRSDGAVVQVYCHWDGYLENNGDLLIKYYNTAEKVAALLAHGNISSLGVQIGQKHQFSPYESVKEPVASYEEADKNGWTTFYGRDRGESGCEARVYVDVAEYEKTGDDGMFEEFNYLFIDGEWYYKSYDGMVRDVRTQLAQARLLEAA